MLHKVFLGTIIGKFYQSVAVMGGVMRVTWAATIFIVTYLLVPQAQGFEITKVSAYQ